METIRFRNDTRQRKRLFVPEAFQHPAKMHCGMLQEIVQRYTKEGDWVLDPMAGVGSTMVAALMGRNVICVELESHFVEPMKASWEKMRMQPMLGFELGQVVIVQGDARDLPFLGKVDGIVSSPPYEGHTAEGGFEYIARLKREGKFTGTTTGISGKGQPWEEHEGQGYTQGDARNLGELLVDSVVTSPPYENLSFSGDTPETQAKAEAHFGRKFGPGQNPAGYTRQVDAVVTSPPWEDRVPAQDSEWLSRFERQSGKPAGIGKALQGGYTRPVDAVVTSPPYEGIETSARQPATKAERKEWDKTGRRSAKGTVGYTRQVDSVVTSPPYEEGLGHGGTEKHPELGPSNRYGGYQPDMADKTNIGNLRATAYWEAMAAVYQECYRVLKPGGVMCLVLKGFTRSGEYVNLPQLTEDLVTSLGFQKFDHWRRELWTLSFWRILQKRRDPEAFDDRLRYESVLAFRKQGG